MVLGRPAVDALHSVDARIAMPELPFGRPRVRALGLRENVRRHSL